MCIRIKYDWIGLAAREGEDEERGDRKRRGQVRYIEMKRGQCGTMFFAHSQGWA